MRRNSPLPVIGSALVGTGGGAAISLLAIGRDVATGWWIAAFAMLSLGLVALGFSIRNPGWRICLWGWAKGWRASSNIITHGPAPLMELRIVNRKQRTLHGIKCSITDPEGRSVEGDNLFMPISAEASEREFQYPLRTEELLHGRHHILWWGYEPKDPEAVPFSPGRRRWLAHDSFQR